MELKFINNQPKPLKEILDDILEPIQKPEGHQEFVDAIMAAKRENENGTADSDEGIQYNIGFCKGPLKDAYYNAYIQYLGMTFYYHYKSNSDAAWYYYAQSRYYRGLYDSWHAALRETEIQLDIIEGKRRGGLKKAAKNTGVLKEKFIEIIKKPPEGGWESKKQLLDVAVPLLMELKNTSNKTVPYGENLLERATEWLRIYPPINKAFIEHHKDADAALEELHSKDKNSGWH